MIQLRALVAAVESGTFTGAARVLGISQPAVSQHIRHLEDELGAELFVRAGRGTTPTPIALELADVGGEAVEAWGRVTAAVARLNVRDSGRLAVGASTTPGAYVLPPVVRSFSALHPEVALDVEIAPAREILTRLRSGRIDLAIVGEVPLPTDVVSASVQNDYLVPVWGLRSPLEGRARVPLREFLEQPLLTYRPGDSTREVLERWVQTRGLRLRPAMEVDSTEAIKQGVAAGLGVGVLSEAAVALELDGKLLDSGHVAGFPIRRAILVALRRGSELKLGALAFLETLMGQRASRALAKGAAG